MKYIFFAMMLMANLAVNAQEQQLILKISKQTETAIVKMSRHFSAIDGIHFSGYAEKASCLLLRFDQSLIPDKKIVVNLIRSFNKKVKVEIIEGLTAFEVIDGEIPK